MIENLQQHLEQLDEVGYTVVPGFMDKSLTARVREHIDALAPPAQPPTEDVPQRIQTLRHPIPGAIMAEILNNPRLLELAKATLRANELRLLEQVLIRTDPKPPPYGAGGWHVDWAFKPEHYNATPRQTYYHMVHMLQKVQPGGGAFMIVPGSHKLTYAATAKVTSDEELQEFKQDPIGKAGIDLSQAIEVPADEGDLLIFNPMCLHSASGNASTQPRYVYFASFFDVSAKYLWYGMRRQKVRDNFPDSLRDNLPEELRPLLEY